MPIPLSVLVAWFFCVSGIGAAVFLIWTTRRWARRRPNPSVPEQLPPITLLKPFDGVDPALRENFRSAVLAPYRGEREVLFCTDLLNAAGIAVAQGVVEEARRSGVKAEIVVTRETKNSPPSRKVRHLEAGAARARHAILVNADSTTRLADGDLDLLVATLLEEERRGAAYAPYVVEQAESIGSYLARLAFTAAPFSFVVVEALRALMRNPPPFLTGGFFAIRREALEGAGGFGAFGAYLTEDLPLAAALGAGGWGIAPSPRPVLRHLAGETVAEHYARVVRWNVAMRTMGEPFYAHYPIAHFPTWLAAPFVALGMVQLPVHATTLGMGFLALLVARQLLAAQIAAVAGGNTEWPERLWSVPVNEAVMAAAFARALVSRTVVWRGVPLAVGEGGRIRVPDREP